MENKNWTGCRWGHGIVYRCLMECTWPNQGGISQYIALLLVCRIQYEIEYSLINTEEVIKHTWDWWRWLGSGCIHTHYPCSGDRQRKCYRTSSMFVKDKWRIMREMSLMTPAETLFSMGYRNWTETNKTQQAAESYPLLYNMFYNMISWSI